MEPGILSDIPRPMAEETLTFHISYTNLRATAIYDDPVPLESLNAEDHVHGELRIEIGGRLVPWLGFFGPDDVCFGTWLDELWQVEEAFRADINGRYVFDEGEQGQPAYLFERSGETAFLSIVDAEYTGGLGDPDWQRVGFSFAEFLAEHRRFRASFIALLYEKAPLVAAEWLEQNTSVSTAGEQAERDAS